MAANAGPDLGSPSQQPSFKPGDRVDYRGTPCVVRFAGVTEFAAGVWIGLELPTKEGKNDGSVNGTRYFDCPPQHGLFVRPSQLKKAAAAAAAAAAAGASSATGTTTGASSSNLSSAQPAPAPNSSAPASVPTASSATVAVPATPKAAPPATPAASNAIRNSLVVPSSASRRPPMAGTGAASTTSSSDFRSNLRSALLDSKPGGSASAASGTVASTPAPASRLARPPVRGTPSVATTTSRIGGTTSASSASAVTVGAASSSRPPSAAGVRATPASSRTSPNLGRAGTTSPALTGTSSSTTGRASIAPAAGATTPRTISPRIGGSTPSTSTASAVKPATTTTPGLRRTSAMGTVAAATTAAAAIGLGLDLGTPAAKPPAASSVRSSPPKPVARAPATPPQIASGSELDLAAETMAETDLADESAPPSPAAERVEEAPVAKPPTETVKVEPVVSPKVEPAPAEPASTPEMAPEAEPEAEPEPEEEQSPAQEEEEEEEEQASPAPVAISSPTTQHTSLMSPRASNVVVALPPAQLKELEELRVRVRVMERQREEDLHRLSEMTRLRSDLEAMERDRNKFQSKVTELQSSVQSLKDDLKAAREEKQALERKLEETAESLESMTLDKEMAEEKTDALQNEVAALKERVEELQVEVELMQAEKEEAELGGGDGADPADGTQAPRNTEAEIRDLKKQIDVLKEALVKLRDINNENELERKKRIQQLEREVAQLSNFKAKAEELEPQLLEAQDALQSLKEQLDDALEAEGMVIELTEKNLALGEKLEELRAANEDLEALKELGDELEENHVETERQLQETIAACETQIREQQGKIDDSAETLADYERTIEQFRTLVRNLQSDIETLQASSSERAESDKHLSSQTQAMMSLTLKLQNTASDVKAKQVELDLRRIEADEAKAKVKLMEPYVPEAVVEKDADSMSCLLSVGRLRQKAELVEKYAEQELRSSKANEESEVAGGELRQGLRYFAGLCARFEAFMDVCSVDEFLELGKLSEELVGTERRIDGMLELSKEQLLIRSPQVLVDLQRCITQMEHLSSTHLGNDSIEDSFVRHWTCVLYSDAVEALIDRLDSEMDGLASVFSHSENQAVAETLRASFFDAVRDELAAHGNVVRQNARKLQRRIAELAEDGPGFVPKADIVEELVRLFNNCTRIVDFFRQLTVKVEAKLKADVELTNPNVLYDLEKILLESETQILRLGEEPPWTGAKAFLESLESGAIDLVEQSVAEDEAEQIERKVSPRVLRGGSIKEHYLLNVKLEKEAKELAQEVATLTVALRKRDESVQESSVKIQLLEKRMGDSKEQAEIISTLEAELAKSQEQEGIFERAVEELQAEIDQLQQENAQLKRNVRRGGGAPLRSGMSTPTMGMEIDSGEAPTLDDLAARASTMPVSGQVEALRALVRYLRLENARLTAQSALLSGLQGTSSVDASGTVAADPLARRMAKLGRSESPKDSASETAPHPAKVLADIRNTLAAPKVVDLSILAKESTGDQQAPNGRSLVRWIPRRLDPVQQYREQSRRLEKLIKEAESVTSAVVTRKRAGLDSGFKTVESVQVGRLRLPGAGSADRASAKINLSWQGLESVHRALITV